MATRYELEANYFDQDRVGGDHEALKQDRRRHEKLILDFNKNCTKFSNDAKVTSEFDITCARCCWRENEIYRK